MIRGWANLWHRLVCVCRAKGGREQLTWALEKRVNYFNHIKEKACKNIAVFSFSFTSNFGFFICLNIKWLKKMYNNERVDTDCVTGATYTRSPV